MDLATDITSQTLQTARPDNTVIMNNTNIADILVKLVKRDGGVMAVREDKLPITGTRHLTGLAKIEAACKTGITLEMKM